MALDTGIIVRPRTGPGKSDSDLVAAMARPAAARGRRVSGRDLIYFTSQLSLMLEVGTSLTDAVAALELQTENPAMLAVLKDLRRDTEAGQSFSAALSRHPAVFDGIFVSMVRAGETGGYLRDAMERIVEMREKREALIAQVRAALAYPAILAVVAIAVIVFVLTGVLPKFVPLFQGKEAFLPASTKMLLAMSRSLTTFWWAWILLVGTACTGFVVFLRSATGKLFRDWLALSVPVVSVLTNKILTGQLLRTLGHLLESHVTLDDALKVTRMTLPNRYYRDLVDRVQTTVEGGGRLSQAFLTFKHMPASVRQMVATGENAGNVYAVMLRLARHYDAEIEQQLKRVASLIEPAALIILGGVVGLVVSSVILPLFKIARTVT